MISRGLMLSPRYTRHPVAEPIDHRTCTAILPYPGTETVRSAPIGRCVSALKQIPSEETFVREADEARAPWSMAM
jgi:hypothetical protein